MPLLGVTKKTLMTTLYRKLLIVTPSKTKFLAMITKSFKLSLLSNGFAVPKYKPTGKQYLILT